MDGALPAFDGPKELRLAELREGLFPVVIAGRVVHAERREVRRRSDGTSCPTLVGWLPDGSATVRFTWWDPPDPAVEAGEGLRAGPVTIREFRGRVELSFGRRTRVEPLGELETPGARLVDFEARPLASVRAGDEEIRCDARVERLDARSRTSRGEERRYFLGDLVDASARVPFVAWVDLGLANGTPYRFLGPYARSYRDRLELVLDERTRIERIDVDDPALQESGDPGSRAPGATVRRTPPPTERPARPPEPGVDAWLDVIRTLSVESADGYAERTALERLVNDPDLAGTPLDLALERLLEEGRIAEPISGLYRPAAPASP